MTWPVEEGGHGPVAARAVRRVRGADRRPARRSPPRGSPTARSGRRCCSSARPSSARAGCPTSSPGASTWCIGMSEPDAGSDVASLRTRAVRDGDDFVVTGTKVWTSGAALADWCYLIARTDPDAPPHAGCPSSSSTWRRRGSASAPIIDMTGNGHFCEVTFDDVGCRRAPRRRAERQLPPGDAPDGARAGRHRPSARATGCCTTTASRWPTSTDARVRQEIAALETGYRIGRLLVLREVLGPGAAPVLGRDEDVLHRVRAARRVVLRARARSERPAGRARPRAAASRATSATRRRTRSWAARPRSCATSSASGSSASPADVASSPNSAICVDAPSAN